MCGATAQSDDVLHETIRGFERRIGAAQDILRRRFYYVIHPADVASTGDLPPDYNCSLERPDVGLSYKTSLLHRSLEVLASSGRRQVTMDELSQAFCRSRNGLPGT